MTRRAHGLARRAALVGDRGRREFHLGDDESPWITLVEDRAWIKHLAFDVRAGTAVNILKVGAGGVLERHRHRGPVAGYTLEGSWRYLEYDWVATPGSWVHEFPGAVHTLASDTGMSTLFWVTGPLELLAGDEVIETMDVFWYMDNYIGHCEANGLPVNEKLFV